MENEIKPEALRNEILRDEKKYKHLNTLLKLDAITRSTFLESVSELILGGIAYGTAMAVDQTRPPKGNKKRSSESTCQTRT